jgi:galactose mutarotase-like enzyme
MACIITDDWSYRGFKTVILENELIRVTVLPDLGAKIHELIYKPSGHDFMYHHPRVECRTPVFDVNIDNWWTGGMDEAIPTGHPCNYKGENFPFLGEAWSLPWSYQIQEISRTEVCLYMRRTLIISPLVVERWITLRQGETKLHLRHKITNSGYQPFEFLWGLHPGFAVTPDCRIDLPAMEVQIEESSPDNRLGEQGTNYIWPYASDKNGNQIDMSLVQPPEAGTMDFHYVTSLKGGWLALTDTKKKVGIALVFPKEVFKSIWLWLVYGGWRSIYVAAVEAWTGYPAKLSDAVDHGEYSSLNPGETLECETKFIIYTGFREVISIDPSGNVNGL